MRALALTIAALFAFRAVRAQDTVAAAATHDSAHVETPYRNPKTAAVLGALFPGAGHVYATDYGRGAAFYFGTVSIVGLGSLVYVIDDCTFTFLSAKRCDPGPEWPHRALGAATIGVGLGWWAYGAVDAPRAARRANERHRRRRQAMSPVVRPRTGARRGINVGLSLAW
ncbi:MAG TPA: hypothetical protein VF761_13980 [Gemmatimonadaceae bacterium]